MTATHHVTVEAQTWRNVPPYPPVTLYRARCECGALGPWYAYRGNTAFPPRLHAQR